MKLNLNFASTDNVIRTKFGSINEEIKTNFSESYVLPSEVIKTDETLEFRNGVLCVNTSKKVEDSILPVTSEAVNDALNNLKESTVKTVNGIPPNTNGNVDVKECISGEELSELLIMIK